MKVFISWSGQRSKEIAEYLSDWLVCVIQAAKPWISTRDIDRGALWISEIGDQLQDTTVGIICLTQENKDRPWILFEAGALAKGLSSSRVITFLIDLQPVDIEDPLAQFNHTLPTKEDVQALVRTINKAMGSAGLEARILDRVFETYWPQFAERFDRIIQDTPAPPAPAPRPNEDVLAEILESTRLLHSRIRKLEARSARPDEGQPVLGLAPGQLGAALAGLSSAEAIRETRRIGDTNASAILNAIKRYGIIDVETSE